MTTVLPDYIAGIIALMKDNGDIKDLVGTDVYGMELPRAEVNNMAQKLIVVSSVGGDPVYHHMKLTWNIVEVRCYGETYYEAWRLHNAAHAFFKGLNRVTYDTLLLHTAIPVNGPITLQDPKFEWPVVLSTWRLLAAEAAVTT